MSRRARANLSLGSAVVELLIAQRRPMLMVDKVLSYCDDRKPTIEACRHVSMNDPIFEGHFPGMPLWPGAFTMEGLGQSSSILLLVATMRQRVSERGGDPESVLDDLRNLDRGYRMHPGFQPDAFQSLLEGLEEYRTLMAVGASADLKFVRPVFPGCRIDYRVEWTDQVGDLVRFSVEASVEGDPVVTGTMTGAKLRRPPGLPV